MTIFYISLPFERIPVKIIEILLEQKNEKKNKDKRQTMRGELAFRAFATYASREVTLYDTLMSSERDF